MPTHRRRPAGATDKTDEGLDVAATAGAKKSARPSRAELDRREKAHSTTRKAKGPQRPASGRVPRDADTASDLAPDVAPTDPS